MATAGDRPYDPYIPAEPATGGAGGQGASGNQRTAALQAVSISSFILHNHDDVLRTLCQSRILLATRLLVAMNWLFDPEPPNRIKPHHSSTTIIRRHDDQKHDVPGLVETRL